jgi:hypothetical protein
MRKAKRFSSAFCGAMIAAFACGATTAASETPSIARELDKIGKNLCKSLDLNCKKKSSAAEAAPRPRQKPAAQAKAKPAKKAKPIEEQESKTASTTPVSIPIPRPKPVTSVSVEVPGAGKPSEPDKTDIPVASITPPPPPTSKDAAPKTSISNGCHEALQDMGAVFTTPPAPAASGACNVEMPVQVTSIGPVILPDKPILNCRFAAKFSAWITEVAEPLVLSKTGSKLIRVSTGSGYECRGRNGDTAAKLSEHGLGNAVDITTLQTAGKRTIQIADAANASSDVADALKGLRTSACGYFTTVLGPGSNEAHAAHLHFDLGRHGRSDAYRICQ